MFSPVWRNRGAGGRSHRPGASGRRFLPADVRLSRARGRRGQVSRRIPQARRPPDHQGDSHRPAHGPAHPAAVPRVVPRRNPDPELRAGLRQAERRRHPGHERGLGRVDDLAAALPGTAGLGALGLHQRRVHRLSHARRVGRERSGPDRLRQQGRHPHDRGVRPRIAREPHDPGHRQGPRAHPRDLRPADRVGPKGERRQGRLCRSRAEPVPGNDPLEVFRRDQAGQADRGQAGPGRGRVGPEGARQGRVDPRFRERRQGAGREVRRGLARVGRPGHSRADSLRHPARRPRRQDVAADQLLGRRAAPRPRLGRVPARRDAGHGHRHARHRQGRAAGGRPGRRVRPEVHAALLLPVVFGGRGAAHPRTRPPRDRPRRPGRAERQAGPAAGGRFSLHDPHHFRHPGVERLQLDGHASAARRWV